MVGRAPLSLVHNPSKKMATSTNKTFSDLGPIHVKDIQGLKRYYDREYASAQAKRKLVDAMPGGEQAYRDMQHRAHTVQHFGGKATKISSLQVPTEQQPQHLLPPSTVDRRFAQSFEVQQQTHRQQLSSANPNRVLAQKGKTHYCKNCGSRMGKDHQHPSGRHFVKCKWNTDEFENNPETLHIGDTNT
jgi:hypothetical protein